MEENSTKKANEPESKQRGSIENEAIRDAEEEAYNSLPATMRFGGQAIHGIKKLYYKLLAGRIGQLQQQVIEQDRELSGLTHDISQLTVEVTQMNHMINRIDARLAQLEDKILKEDSKGHPNH